MSRFQRVILGILSATACGLTFLVAVMSIQIYQSWARQSIGPALPNPQPYTPLSLPPIWTASPENAGTSSPNKVTEPTGPVETLSPQLAPSPLPMDYLSCGAPPVINLLVVGADQRSSSYIYGLGDVIRLVRIDSLTPRVSVLEFPRDLWVEIPDIADNLNGQDHEKLNQAYLYGNSGFGYTSDPAQGPGLLARTLNLNFGVQLDHYIGVNMRTFIKVVNAVDGIDIILPNGVDGRTAEDRSARLVFPPGLNHLNGDEALTLARIRNEGVFARADHQDLVLCALREKLTRPQVITQLPQLIASFQHSVQTDLSPELIGQLACLGPRIRPENILFASFPQEFFKATRVFDPVFDKNVFIWDVDFNLLREYVTRFQAGTWPVPGPAPAPGDEGPVVICQ